MNRFAIITVALSIALSSVIVAVVLIWLLTASIPNHYSPSSYPAPVTTYNGRTAEEWGKQAKDANPNQCYEALIALNRLGKEGTPFILEALALHDKAGRVEHVSMCLGWCNANNLLDKDLKLLIPYLDAKRPIYVIKPALTIVRWAGNRASFLIPHVEKLTSHPDLSSDAKEIVQILKIHDGTNKVSKL